MHNDITDLITSINSFGTVLVREDVSFDGMSFKVSEELDDKLRNIPENQQTFDMLYQGVPPFLLQQSVRMMKENEDGTLSHSPEFIVICGEIDDDIRDYVKSFFGDIE